MPQFPKGAIAIVEVAAYLQQARGLQMPGDSYDLESRGSKGIVFIRKKISALLP